MSIVWLTGNTGSGKSTLAERYQQQYPEDKVIILDGDEMRKSISTKEGFSLEDREKHCLRVARLAEVLSSQDYLVLIAVIAPTNRIRKLIDQEVKDNIGWVYIDKVQEKNPEKPYEVPDDASCISRIYTDYLAKQRCVLELHGIIHYKELNGTDITNTN